MKSQYNYLVMRLTVDTDAVKQLHVSSNYYEARRYARAELEKIYSKCRENDFIVYIDKKPIKITA